MTRAIRKALPKHRFWGNRKQADLVRGSRTNCTPSTLWSTMAAAKHRNLFGRVVSARARRSRRYARSFRKSSPLRVWVCCCSPCKCGTRTTVSNLRQTCYTADEPVRCGNTHSVLLTRRRLARRSYQCRDGRGQSVTTHILLLTRHWLVRRSCQCRDGRGQSATTTAGRCKLLGRSREHRARHLE